MADIKTNFPELFGELTSLEDKRWLVVYTKPRREKKLAEYAFKSNINYYLPMFDSKKHYQRKMVVYKKPMFSNYVFVRVNYEERQQLVITGHTVCFLNVKDEKQLLEELAQINQVKETGVELTAHPYLKEGTRVRFKEGPLTGVIGVVQDVKNINKVVLQVHILKNAIAVTAESSNFEVLDEFLDDED